MKYTREDLSSLSYKDYILAMEKELNAKGFLNAEGEPYKVSTAVNGSFVSDFFRAFVLGMKDDKAVNYLKEIGLINNGRCPLTGLMISNSERTTYTSEYNSLIRYDINRRWIEYNKTKRNWGCFLGIFVLIVSVVVLFAEGLGCTFYYTIGAGFALCVVSSLYGGSKLGRGWNMANLSNQLCINTITLYEIMKIEENEGLSSHSINKYNIPYGDIESYQKWSYSSDLDIK